MKPCIVLFTLIRSGLCVASIFLILFYLPNFKLCAVTASLKCRLISLFNPGNLVLIQEW